MSEKNIILEQTYLSLPDVFYQATCPTPVKDPSVFIYNEELADCLNLNLSEQQKLSWLSGNKLPQDLMSFSQAYAGHQYGFLTMLGDGRAVILGEHVGSDGKRYDLGLKGSGRTPFSRQGDGRAALGPMLREYLISEAMHSLNIPTTRSLAVIKTGETIQRATQLSGAILTRVAGSHIRIGTFEFAAMQQNQQILQALCDYTIERHFADIRDSDNPPLMMLRHFAKQQADLVVAWLRVGFIHGVMNTDNVSLSGETMDYGPCAFLDHYDLKTVFSSIDEAGRYAFGQQPSIAQWNIARFAEAILPLISENPNEAQEMAQEVIEDFGPLYRRSWQAMMCGKLGFINVGRDEVRLVDTMLRWLAESQADYTNTFYDLMTMDHSKHGYLDQAKPFGSWYHSWVRHIDTQRGGMKAAKQIMQQQNPVVIPRNHLVEQALNSACSGDRGPFDTLLKVLRQPYAIGFEQAKPFQTPPTEKERICYTFCGT